LPHTRSARKSHRKSLTRRLRNRAVKTHLKTRLKQFGAAIAAGDVEAAKRQALLLQKSFDKAVTHGVIHKSNAAHHTSAAARKLNKLLAPKAAS
jgi:small subunit ribosomal protein S20